MLGVRGPMWALRSRWGGARGGRGVGGDGALVVGGCACNLVTMLDVAAPWGDVAVMGGLGGGVLSRNAVAAGCVEPLVLERRHT